MASTSMSKHPLPSPGLNCGRVIVISSIQAKALCLHDMQQQFVWTLASTLTSFILVSAWRKLYSLEAAVLMLLTACQHIAAGNSARHTVSFRLQQGRIQACITRIVGHRHAKMKCRAVLVQLKCAHCSLSGGFEALRKRKCKPKMATCIKGRVPK